MRQGVVSLCVYVICGRLPAVHVDYCASHVKGLCVCACGASLLMAGFRLGHHEGSLSISLTNMHRIETSQTHTPSLALTLAPPHTAPRTICYRHQANHASSLASSTSRLPTCKCNARMPQCLSSYFHPLHLTPRTQTSSTYIRHRAPTPAPILTGKPFLPSPFSHQHSHTLTHPHTHNYTGD